MILVTGGTGLVGSHLLFELCQNNISVRAIYRSESKLNQVRRVFSFYSENADKLLERIDWIKADLNDISSLEEAFKNIRKVYHCAALISFDPNDFKRLVEVNEEGTGNIVNLSISHKIDKLCYVSSIAALGKDPNSPEVTEQSEWRGTDVNPYALTKYLAEMEVWRGSQEGISTVIVNPGVILGPGFWESGSGRLFQMAAKGNRYYPPGGTGFVGVHDVVRMMVQLMESSVINEQFISVSDNLTYKEILTRLANTLQKPAPRKMLSIGLLEILWRLDWFWHLISKSKRKLSRLQVASLKTVSIYNTDKIAQHIDFEYSAQEDYLAKYCELFKEAYPSSFS